MAKKAPSADEASGTDSGLMAAGAINGVQPAPPPSIVEGAPPPAGLAAGDELRPFPVAWPVMIDGQTFEAGAEVLVTRSMHRDLHAAGAILDAWPTVPEA